MVLALSLDALLLLVIAPAVVLRGVLGAYSAASSCEGVGCEGPLMLLLLVVVPVVWLVLAGGYVLLSRRWGRTPAMALLRVPRRP